MVKLATAADHAAAMSEADLQACIIDAAKTFRWLHFHDHDSRRNQAGLPDLLLARRGRVIFAELKSATGRVKPRQMEWISTINSAAAISDGALEIYVWRPADWLSGAIIRVLM